MRDSIGTPISGEMTVVTGVPSYYVGYHLFERNKKNKKKRNRVVMTARFPEVAGNLAHVKAGPPKYRTLPTR